jgi:serine/threonine protein kinase
VGVSAGTRLGPYEIVAAIGAGGMGEVYKARGTRLQRDVALKILPDIVTADPDVSLQERGHWWPNVLPDNRHVLFTI